MEVVHINPRVPHTHQQNNLSIWHTQRLQKAPNHNPMETTCRFLRFLHFWILGSCFQKHEKSQHVSAYFRDFQQGSLRFQTPAKYKQYSTWYMNPNYSTLSWFFCHFSPPSFFRTCSPYPRDVSWWGTRDQRLWMWLPTWDTKEWYQQVTSVFSVPHVCQKSHDFFSREMSLV